MTLGLDRVFPLHTGVAAVTAIRPLTPAMSRFTLHAPAFADPGVEQPGEILTLGWPEDGAELVLPEAGWRFPADRPEQHWRNFTVRRFDPARATIDVDFFLHARPSSAAPSRGRDQPAEGPRVSWVSATSAP